jgi:hypothetical protein
MGTETYNSMKVSLLLFIEKVLVRKLGYGCSVCISVRQAERQGMGHR